MASNDWGVPDETFCGGAPDDEPVCPTPCYLCGAIHSLHLLRALDGVGTRLVCRDCYHRDTSEEE